MIAPWIKLASGPRKDCPPEAQTLPLNSRKFGVSVGSSVARLANLVQVRKSESGKLDP